MRNREYFNELKLLKKGIRTIPSPRFCGEFVKRYTKALGRLDKHWDNKLSTSEKELIAQGTAIGKTTHSKKLIERLKLWAWVSFHNAIDQDDIDELENAAMEVLDLEEKMLNTPSKASIEY